MNQIRLIYKKFFRWCIEMEYIKKSPALNLSPERAKTENTLPIKKKEIQLFFDTIDNSNDPYTIRDKTLFAVYAYIGVRKNEALILRVRDLDFSEGIIHIQSSKSGKERRRVIIPKKLIKILKTYLKERKENVKNKVENDWLFPGVTGEKHFSSRQAHNRFIKC